MARRTGEYGASSLAEPATKRGIRDSTWILICTLQVEDEAVPRCTYETFKCGDRRLPAARLVCTDDALCDARTTRNFGL